MCKTFCNFEPRIWLESITSCDAQSACFKGSKTSRDVIMSGVSPSSSWPKKIASRDGCVRPADAAAIVHTQLPLSHTDHYLIKNNLLNETSDMHHWEMML